MEASLSDFLIQLAGLSAIGGFGYLVYRLNHSGEKDNVQEKQ
ncbi:hypothetical protein [Salinicoccus halodurans]|uniref:Uncharacterized protein n=1 Tax=Salinicoccus halodurans TaxID=407035 RepID=A0AA94HH04_9STAP|nr:hypothetical protein [Salinicoccus halodurans]SFK88229.1 hypothetical protein SAMN05216235_2211 [Salinicoccus halodurans]